MYFFNLVILIYCLNTPALMFSFKQDLMLIHSKTMHLFGTSDFVEPGYNAVLLFLALVCFLSQYHEAF